MRPLRPSREPVDAVDDGGRHSTPPTEVTTDWHHRDLFDRVLAAEAMIESLTLLTADTAFADLSGLATRW